MAGSMRIGKHKWEIEDASVAACVLPLDEADRSWGPGTNGIIWSFNIRTCPLEIDGESRSPYLYHQVFLAPISSWRALEGMTFIADSEREIPCICIDEHEGVANAAFAFGRREGTRFEFTFTGDYLWFEMEPDQVVVETWIHFKGVVAYSTDEEEAWRLVHQHLEGQLRRESAPPIDMTQGRFQYRFVPE